MPLSSTPLCSFQDHFYSLVLESDHPLIYYLFSEILKVPALRIRAVKIFFYRLRPGPVRDFGTERALVEPLGPNTTNFPSSWTRFTLLTELNLTVPKARPEAHTFDFIGTACSILMGRGITWAVGK